MIICLTFIWTAEREICILDLINFFKNAYYNYIRNGLFQEGDAFYEG